MRSVAFLLLILLAVAAIAASNARKPMLVEASPNPTPIVRADFQRCVPVSPGPIKPATKPRLYPHNSELS
ncbi:MAG: hypothetical protein ACM3ZV_07365 [Bacillota bacterium]